MICGAAKHSRRAASLAVADDPVFAAIEERKRAEVAFVAAIDQMERVETALPRELTKWHHDVLNPEPPPNNGDAPEWIAAECAHRDASNAECQALVRLVSTQPTTIQGAAALIAYAVKCQDNGDPWDGGTHTGDHDSVTGDPLYCEIIPTMSDTLVEALSAMAGENCARLTLVATRAVDGQKAWRGAFFDAQQPVILKLRLRFLEGRGVAARPGAGRVWDQLRD